MAAAKSTVSVNASQAIAEMERLTLAMIGTEAATVKTQAAFSKLRGGNAAAGIGKIATKTAEATRASEKLNRQTLQTLEAFIRYNIINQIFNRVTRGIKSAIDASKELQLSIAEIQTLAPSSNTAQLTSSVLDISSNFGIEAAQTAEAVYQALSNQVGTLSESLQFVEKTAEFAKGAFVDLADAGDLVAGIMKAYGLELNNVGAIQDKLFRAIDLGRITADELAGSFGVLTQPAATLGISLDELLVSLDAITISGVKSDRAITGLRNVLFTLLKPSDDLTAALDQIGVSSVKAGIGADGLIGFLSKLAGTTGGVSSELAKLFPNLRAFQGANSLLADGGEKLNETLIKFQSNLKGVSKQAAEVVRNTNADKLNRQLETFKNTLTKGIGDGLVAFQSAFINAFGGAETAAKALTLVLKLGAGPALAGLLIGVTKTGIRLVSALFSISAAAETVATTQAAVAAESAILSAGLTTEAAAATLSTSANYLLSGAFIAEGIAAAKAAIATRGLAVSIFLVTAAALPFAVAGAIIGAAIGALFPDLFKASNQAEELRKRLKTLKDGFVEFYKKRDNASGGFNDDLKDQIANLKEQRQTTLSSLNTMDAAYKRHRSLVVAQYDQITASLRDQIKERIQIVENLLDSIINRTKTARKEIERAANFARDFDRQASDLLFESKFSKLEDPTKQADALKKRAAAFQDAAKAAFSSGEVDKAEQLLQDQLNTIGRILNIKGQEKVGEQLLADAIENSNRFLAQRVAIAKENENALGAQEVPIRQQLVQIQKLNAAYEELGKQILSASTEKQQIELSIDQAEVAKQIRQALDGIDPKVLELGVGKDVAQRLRDDFIDPASGTTAPLEIAVATSALQFRNDLQTELDKTTPIEVQIALKNAGFEKSFQGLPTEQIATQFQEQETLLQNAGQLRDKQNEYNASLLATRRLLAEIGEGVDLNKFLPRSETLRSAEIFKEQIQGIDSALQSGDLQTALDRLTAIRNAVQTTNFKPPDLTPIIQGVGDTAELGAEVEKTKNEFFSLSAQTSGVLRLAEAILSAAEAQRELNEAKKQESAGSGGSASGGGIFRAGGGFAPGTDTVNTNLSPGEFVVNARSAREFHSQLIAMNSGRSPINRANGGDVTNVSNTQFGDVVINNPDRGTNARKLAADFKRELRRETISL